MKIEGNTVTVDGFQFEIDRSIPKIVGDGEPAQISGITIEANFIGTTPYLTGSLHIEIRSEKTISQITIDGVNMQIPEKNEEGVYILEDIEVNQNRDYIIIAKAEDGKTETLTKSITQIAEEDTVWEIKNEADLKKFRDAVNAGNSFKEKIINITAKTIDLEGSVEEKKNSWTPIGTEEHPFEGTFEGNGCVIKNLYIENADNYQGLFGHNKGIIQNLIIENGNVKSEGGKYIALAVGLNEGTISNITTNGYTEGTAGVGGVVGSNFLNGNIVNCINNAEINYSKVAGDNKFYGSSIGGIVGSMEEKDGSNNRVERCINKGKVTGARTIGGIVGTLNKGTIYLCTNNGEVVGEKSSDNATMVGGIAGEVGYYTPGSIEKSINSGKVSATVSPLALGGISGRGVYCTIQDSYNLGNIVSGYGIAGYSSTTTQNNYWLSGCGASYGKNGSSNSGATPKTKLELETLANQLIAKTGDDKELGNNLLKELEKITE